MLGKAIEASAAGAVGWPDDAIARYVAEGCWQERSITQHLYAVGDATPEAICLVDGDRRLSYRELMSRADGLAARLREIGLRPDDRVVLQLPNSWEFVVVLVACMRLGLIPAMALTSNRRYEIAAVAAHTEARALIVPDRLRDFDHQAEARAVADDSSSVEHVLVVGADVRPGHGDVRAMCRPADDVAGTRTALDALAPAGRSLALFLLSGGTTGVPKLIARTHNDFTYMASRSAALCDVDSADVYLAVLPLAHGYPMSGPGALGTLLNGGTVVLASSPDPERAFALIERHRVTMTSLVPAVAQRWLEHRQSAHTRDLSSLRLLQVAAARLGEQTAEALMAAFGPVLQQVYGMSEGLLCLTRPDDPEEVVRQTQGRPISPHDELLVVDDRGEPVPAGRRGILLTRGPYTPRGYYRAPELNARAFVGDGWYNTGDIVRLRPDGNLVVEGRDKDVINRGGEKIWAEEIEGFAREVPGVAMAAAVPMPDPELGERICLYVVVRPGATVELATVRQVMEQLGTAHFKMPERLVVVDDIPLTAVGKTDKRALRADAGRRAADERAGR